MNHERERPRRPSPRSVMSDLRDINNLKPFNYFSVVTFSPEVKSDPEGTSNSLRNCVACMNFLHD